MIVLFISVYGKDGHNDFVMNRFTAMSDASCSGR